MDIKMERLDGLKAAEEIRRMDSAVGLVFLTSSPNPVFYMYAEIIHNIFSPQSVVSIAERTSKQKRQSELQRKEQ